MSSEEGIATPGDAGRAVQDDSILPISDPSSSLPEDDMGEEDHATEPSLSAITGKRTPLVISSTKAKGTPYGYIALDRALDRIGIEKYPNDWGMSENWHLMPFMKRSGPGNYCIRIINGKGKHRRLLYIRMEVGESSDDFKACARMYVDVCRTMIAFLQSGDTSSSLVRADGLILPVTDQMKGIWNTRRKSIFYTGHVRFGYSKQLYRVVVDESSFEDLMSVPPEKRILSKDNVIIARIRRVIDVWGGRGEYKIRRESLNEIVKPVLQDFQLERLNGRIEDDIWNKLVVKQIRAQPKKEDIKAFERDKDELREKIKTEILRR